jgi:hypothetical protein
MLYNNNNNNNNNNNIIIIIVQAIYLGADPRPIGQLQGQHKYKETTNKQNQNKGKVRTKEG